MKKQIKKQYKKLVKHLHPVNLHIGVWVSIAAIVATMAHSGHDIIHAVYGTPVTLADAGNNTLRQAREYETHVGHAQISTARRTYNGGS